MAQRASRSTSGFTLIELIVVVVLIGLMISMAVPRFDYALLTDNLKTATRRMIGEIRELREDAIREHKDYILHLDLNSNQYWSDSPAMSEEERAMTKTKASTLPEGVRFLDVWFMGEGKIVMGEVAIRFSKKGYAPRSVIHLGSEDDRAFTIELSPFLGKVKVFQEYIEYTESEARL